MLGTGRGGGEQSKHLSLAAKVLECRRKGREQPLKPFVLPVLSCKLVTAELICEKSDLAFRRRLKQYHMIPRHTKASLNARVGC